MEMPSGCRSSAPAPAPSAIGTAPSAAARVVMMIGRKRMRAASRIAVSASTPSRRRTSAKSIIMIAFFFTMPINSRMPMIATTDRSMLNHLRKISAPRPAEGRPDRMVIGWM